jgi:hypothetical protein
MGAGSTTVGASPGRDLWIKIQELNHLRSCSVQAQDSLIGCGFSLSLGFQTQERALSID